MTRNPLIVKIMASVFQQFPDKWFKELLSLFSGQNLIYQENKLDNVSLELPLLKSKEKKKNGRGENNLL